MIQLPYSPTFISHRHGGTVLEITGIAHRIEKSRGGRSMDTWHFIGRVSWDEGYESTEHPIDPALLCSPSEVGQKEIGELSDAMMAYLGEHGDWCDSKSGHQGWYAHRKQKSLMATNQGTRMIGSMRRSAE